MDKLSLIQNIKASLKKLMTFAEPTMEPTGMLVSGQKIWTEDNGPLEVGKIVNVYDATSDSLLPLSDGEYELEDGTKFTIVNGMIGEVMAPETESETEVSVEVEVEAEAAAPADTTTPSPEMEKIMNLETKVAELEMLVNSMIETMDHVTEVNTKMKKQLEKFLKEPADEGVKFAKVEKKKDLFSIDETEAIEAIRKRNANKNGDYSTLKISK
jgi:enamine deaminase RidA (YjgF/YER057c/UK114 family)